MDWLELLTAKVEQLGRRQVEADTGMSKAALSLVLNQKYNGNMDNIKAKVMAAYSQQTVTCPVLDVIPVRRCLTEQNKPFSATSPQRVALFRACQSCPHKQRRS